LISTKIKYSVLLTFVILANGIFTNVFAQGQKQIVQLSGIIVGDNENNGLPGVHIYVPKAGRGTTTNYLGYFSMPVLANDSIVISSVGYKKQSYIVPSDPSLGDNITLLIELVNDITYLDEVQIVPFPTEELFKEAIIALNLPMDTDHFENDQLSGELLAYMASITPMDGNTNHWNFMNQYNANQQRRYMVPTNPFLNPFNWANFIQAIKRGDFKKK
jgi:hypothetical protein